MTESFMGRRGFWQTIVNHRFQAPTWRSTQQVLRVCCAVLVGLGAAGESFGQRNNVEYPDWATRFPAVELYEPDCGPLYLPNKYGPFDYRALAPADRDLVERSALQLRIRSVPAGERLECPARQPGTTGRGIQLHTLGFSEPVAGIWQQWRISAIRLQDRKAARSEPARPLLLSDERSGLSRTMSDVRALYGYYYARRGKVAEARQQLEKAEALDSSKANVWLYVAFAYLEIKDYEKSLTAAKRAYAAGYSLPGLRRRLERAGAWRD
jgi:tetratricopeptide (TPR) repeat protein